MLDTPTAAAKHSKKQLFLSWPTMSLWEAWETHSNVRLQAWTKAETDVGAFIKHLFEETECHLYLILMTSFTGQSFLNYS